MSFSWSGMWISISLLLVWCVFFFWNKKPTYVVPSHGRISLSWNIYRWAIFLALLGILLLPLRLSFVSDTYVITQKNLPVQIILDVSLSMAAHDIQPSRFVSAKNSLISLIHQLDGYYISLITFSGKPVLYIPFSSSSSAIVTKLSGMNLWDFPPLPDFLWTAIGDALLLWIQNLQYFSQQSVYKPGVVLLITDGDSNIGFDPMQVVDLYQKMSIPLYVLGIWSSNYLIGRDTWNTDITTNINVSLLQSLADKTWWLFLSGENVQDFDQFFSLLVQDIVTQQQQSVHTTVWEITPYVLYILGVDLLGLLIFTFYLFVIFPKKWYNNLKTT